ncbi:MAG TPA: C-terminal helicase domain-containing protein, partial [Gemmatimonadaceae bacterium]|nr:C-terminal helicase domain-containing protein [Gemmatimonadaceae bacterium]
VCRRIAKAAALALSLESGNYPTARELEIWTYGEGALQLGFAELLSSPTDDAAALLDCVRSHSTALRDFHALHGADTALDGERGEILVAIRAGHPTARIVAFAQYAETVSALYRRLSSSGGVAMLTAQGGVTVGGKITRDEALARFAPSAMRSNAPAAAQRIDLLLATDLLSEGVNLQDADVVVHMDVPWTAARMEQRVGRVARIGSRHQRVHVYLIHPPESAAAVLGNELLVQRKWHTAKRAIGSSARSPVASESEAKAREARLDSVPAKVERLRGLLERWRRSEAAGSFDRLEPGDTLVASVQAPESGCVAAISVGDRNLLFTYDSHHASIDVDSQIGACLLCGGDELETNAADYETAVSQIRDWFEHDLASASAGVEASSSSGRKRLLSRIDAAIESAPPHIRASLSRIAARARVVATSQHGAAIEAELDLLARSPLPDHEWLELVAGLGSARPGKEHDAKRAKLMIHAVLLMREHP